MTIHSVIADTIMTTPTTNTTDPPPAIAPATACDDCCPSVSLDGIAGLLAVLVCCVLLGSSVVYSTAGVIFYN